mgnify:CR=1 FL=1
MRGPPELFCAKKWGCLYWEGVILLLLWITADEFWGMIQNRIPGRGRRLLFPHLGPVHPGISAVELHQLFVGAFLGDPAIFYQQDEI